MCETTDRLEHCNATYYELDLAWLDERIFEEWSRKGFAAPELSGEKLNDFMNSLRQITQRLNDRLAGQR